MTSSTYDPARVFVRGGALAEGVEWSVWLALIVWWIDDLQLGELQLAFLGTVLLAAVLVSETPTGVVADLHGRRQSLIIAQVVMGLSFFWSGISENYWIILPAQAMAGIGWTFRSGADVAWLTDELKGHRRDEGSSSDGAAFDEEAFDEEVEQLLLLKHRVGIGIGIFFLVGTIILAELASVRIALFVAAAIHTSVALYYVFVMREDHFVPGSDADDESNFMSTLRSGLSAISGRPRLRVILAVAVAIDVGAEAYDRLGYKYFLDNTPADDSSIVSLGVLFVVIAIAGILINLQISARLESGVGVAKLATLLIVIAVAGGLVMAATTTVLAIGFGYLLQDSTREAFYPVLESWTNRDAPSEVRATVHSLVGQAAVFGELIGGLALGLIAELTSIRVTLVVGAACFAVAAALATRGIERTPTPDRV